MDKVLKHLNVGHSSRLIDEFINKAAGSKLPNNSASAAASLTNKVLEQTNQMNMTVENNHIQQHHNHQQNNSLANKNAAGACQISGNMLLANACTKQLTDIDLNFNETKLLS